MVSRSPDSSWCPTELGTEVVGRSIRYYPRIDSTNEQVRRLAEAGEAEGTVVVADTQIAGRGRRGRRWLDEPGQALLFSVLLRPICEQSQMAILSLGVAAACAESLISGYSIPIVTKWPNDLLVAGDKVGGILLEQRGSGVVVGVGLNVNGRPEVLQAQVGAPLTTLEEHYGAPLPRKEVLVSILEKIDDIYQQFQGGRFAEVVDRYRRFESVLGRKVCVRVEQEVVCGIAMALMDSGALVVNTLEGECEIVAGEVELVAEGE